MTQSQQTLDHALAPFRTMAVFEDFELTCPESRGMDDDTPLRVAAWIGRLDWLAALLPHVTDIDVAGDLGNTPLHCALISGQDDIANWLVENSASLATLNDYDETPERLLRERSEAASGHTA